jgi:histidinol-phosphatase
VRSAPATGLSSAEYGRVLRCVRRALRAADGEILPRYRRTAIAYKADGTEVTAADRGAERALRRVIAAAFPEDAIVGEEFGGTRPARGRCWLIDPIDGTAQFALGLPTFGTLVGLTVDGIPEFGCIHLPVIGETTYAARGHGCWFRDGARRPRRVHVAAAKRLARARLSVTSLKCSDLAHARGPLRLSALFPAAGRVSFVGDCTQYALLCRGLIDAALDPLMHPWDVAALVPCVQEAGGALAPLDGSRGSLLQARNLAAASSRALLGELLERLRAPLHSRRGRTD